MGYELLPAHLRPVATAVERHFRRKKCRIYRETELKEEYYLRPTLICRKGRETDAIEIRPNLHLDSSFIEFVTSCLAADESVRIWLAVPSDENGESSSLTLTESKKYKSLGVGIIEVIGNRFSIVENPVECNLRFTIADGAHLGKHQAVMDSAESKFNSPGHRLDALRDVVTEVEESVRDLGIRAIRKGQLNISESDFLRKDWDERLNILNQPTYGGKPQRRLLTETEYNENISFKDARNLCDHPRSKSQEISLAEQYLLRMHQSVRLLRLLIRKKRGL